MALIKRSEHIVEINEGFGFGEQYVLLVVDYLRINYEITHLKIDISNEKTDFIDHLTKALKEADDLAKKLLKDNETRLEIKKRVKYLNS